MAEQRDSKNLDDGQDDQPLDRQRKPSLNPLQVIGSVLAAGLGVQSSRNRERDFKQGRLGVFVAAGIIFTLIFIGTVYAVVQLVLRGAAS